MPIEATPPEQVVVALAIKCTGDESVLPVPGEETDTPANAQTDSVSKQNSVFIGTPALSIGPDLAQRRIKYGRSAGRYAMPGAELFSTVLKQLLWFKVTEE